MIRIICERSDDCRTVHTGAPPLVEHRTFDVELAELEKWLVSNPEYTYEEKRIVGFELLP